MASPELLVAADPNNVPGPFVVSRCNMSRNYLHFTVFVHCFISCCTLNRGKFD